MEKKHFLQKTLKKSFTSADDDISYDDIGEVPLSTRSKIDLWTEESNFLQNSPNKHY